MSNFDIIKKKIKLIIFDQYGTIVDMQKGLTEAVIPFLKNKKWVQPKQRRKRESRKRARTPRRRQRPSKRL